jgi:ADP-dependent NAD(P)H-hydrate dehydratase / NAD(P)H-hydrate epimerase
MSASFAHATPVYLTSGIRHIETLASAMPDRPTLMERAGLAAAELARDLAGSKGKPLLVLAGPGNNGGDAFVVARHLRQWWFKTEVVFTGNESKLTTDAAAALQAWRAAGGSVSDTLPPRLDCGLIIDGLFGIGLQREVTGRHAGLIHAINHSGIPVLALDVPSGLDSDTGRVLGCAVRASHTVTFIGLKPGLLTLDGPDHCGELHLRTLGLDTAQLLPAQGVLVGAQVLESVLPPRPRNSHKGSFGSVAIIGGAHGMTGAALLAGRAALRLGAGRVYVGLLDDGPAVDMQQPELMLRTADEVLKLDQLTCLALGPGLGNSPEAAHCLQRALQSRLPLVIDADGLNLLAISAGLKDVLKQMVNKTLLTPHPAEAARLLNCTTQQVQHDRIAAARRIAAEWNCHVVLKGAGSVCASPDQSWAINTSGNPGMASAGMGDVLTGILAALVSQGADLQTALRAGVHLHGAAADAQAAEGKGPVGLTSSEVTDAARTLLNAAYADTKMNGFA